MDPTVIKGGQALYTVGIIARASGRYAPSSLLQICTDLRRRVGNPSRKIVTRIPQSSLYLGKQVNVAPDPNAPAVRLNVPDRGGSGKMPVFRSIGVGGRFFER